MPARHFRYYTATNALAGSNAMQLLPRALASVMRSENMAFQSALNRAIKDLRNAGI